MAVERGEKVVEKEAIEREAGERKKRKTLVSLLSRKKVASPRRNVNGSPR